VTYRLLLKRSAERELDAIREPAFSRIKRKLLALEEHPRPVGIQKLHGQAAYQVRVGDYRILYTIDDVARHVEIIAIGHRRDVYR